ncbi:MAG: copper homeostasis protein CutC [Maribacter sp.]|nr:copper homeostasis protein CutC [Maribacter sp.]
MLVEVCANSVESALNAQKAGADRIELCTELGVGGVTPSFGLLNQIKKKITLPVHVLIRPRSGDFTYSEAEFETMLQDIALCVELGFQGIVSGVLHNDFTLDVARTRQLIDCSNGLEFTFHRAFDWIKNPLEALQLLEGLGVQTILTSGQRNSALQGIGLLSQLHNRSTQCTLMPGGGIRPDNVKIFKEKGFKAIHLSGIKYKKSLPIAPMVSMFSHSFLKDDEIGISDVELLRKIVENVK